MKKCLIVILYSLIYCLGFAQQKHIPPIVDTALHKIRVKAEEYLLNNTDSALIIYKQGLDIANRYDDTLVKADFISDIGRAYLYKGNQKEALRYLQDGYDIYLSINAKDRIIDAQFNLGLVNIDLGNLEKSKELFNTCIRHFNTLQDTFRLAQAYNNLGMIALYQDSLELTISYYNKSLNLKKLLKDETSVAFGNNNLGDLYLRTYKFDSARIVYNENLQIAKKIENNALLLATYIGLATIDIYTEITPNTKYYIDEAERIANIVNAAGMKRIAYYKHVEYYAAIEDYKNAYTNFVRYHTFSDSLLNIENQKAMQELQIQYETDRKNREIIALKENTTLNQRIIKQQKILIFIGIAFFVVVVIVLILFVRLFSQQRKLNRILKIKNEYIEQQNQELKRLNITKDRFFSIIAHDLKAPFSNLLGFTELLEIQIDGLSKKKILEYSSLINGSGRRIFTLLENLLTWARTQTDKIEPSYDTVSVYSVVNSINQLLADGFESKKNIFVNNVPEDLNIFSDKEMLSTILRNMVINSNKYTEHGEISVGCSATSTQITIFITDTGVGMTEEQTAKLFDFAELQSVSGTKGEKGTGLGMHLCYELIQILQGSIEVVSQINEGTTVKILLPLSNE